MPRAAICAPQNSPMTRSNSSRSAFDASAGNKVKPCSSNSPQSIRKSGRPIIAFDASLVSGWIARNHGIGGNVAGDDGAEPDHGVLADRHLVPHSRTRRDVNAGSDATRAADRRV